MCCCLQSVTKSNCFLFSSLGNSLQLGFNDLWLCYEAYDPFNNPQLHLGLTNLPVAVLCVNFTAFGNTCWQF